MAYETHRAAACQWTATTTHSIDSVKLTVRGMCEQPRPGYKFTLSHVDLPGTDPSTLTLVLIVVTLNGYRAVSGNPDPGGVSANFRLTERSCPGERIIFEPVATVHVSAQ